MESPPTNHKEFFLHSPTKHRFFVQSTLPEKARGIILIIPGMAEHAGRYTDFSSHLTHHGFGVYVCDHPGQGQTAGSKELTGIVDKNRAWQQMLENVRTLYTHIRKNHTALPIYVFGHSMGSVIARHFTALYPVYIQGMVLSGTFSIPSWILHPLSMLVQINVLFQGQRKKSKWFNRFFYANFNRHFKNSPTLFEWISSDRKEVDTYVNDPYCGFDCSNGFYIHLLNGICSTRKSETLRTYRKTLPVLILSGDKDPVGHFGKDAIRLHKEFYSQNFQNLSLKIFRGRHELLHETIKEKVYDYLTQWFDQSLHIR